MSKGLRKRFRIILKQIQVWQAFAQQRFIYLLHLQIIQLLTTKKQAAMMQDLYCNNKKIC